MLVKLELCNFRIEFKANKIFTPLLSVKFFVCEILKDGRLLHIGVMHVGRFKLGLCNFLLMHLSRTRNAKQGGHYMYTKSPKLQSMASFHYGQKCEKFGKFHKISDMRYVVWTKCIFPLMNLSRTWSVKQGGYHMYTKSPNLESMASFQYCQKAWKIS